MGVWDDGTGVDGVEEVRLPPTAGELKGGVWRVGFRGDVELVGLVVPDLKK